MAGNKANKQMPQQNSEQTTENKGDKKNFRWNLRMDQSLADIRREQRQKGNKGDNGWKPVAFNNAAATLSAKFGVIVTADNIKNRIKTWKSWYAIVSDILSQSGFTWDANSKMITIDSEHAWQEYCQSHKDAEGYRFKVISNWEDIVDICGKDRATGNGAETGEEAIEIMTPEDNDFVDLAGNTEATEGNPNMDDVLHSQMDSRKNKKQPSSDVHPSKRRNISTKDIFAASVAEMATSFKEFVQASATKLDAKEVYAEVNAIPDLSGEEQIKAYAWLIENEKQFLMLKAIPIERKKDMVLMFLSSKA